MTVNQRRILMAGALAALALVAVSVDPSTSRADLAPVDPTNPATPPTVTADALPTVQINGVVWSQVIVGNTVFAGGRFTSARPAGAAAGTSETPVTNLISYDLTTGVMTPTFKPVLDAQVRGVAASPDGSRVYICLLYTSPSPRDRG